MKPLTPQFTQSCLELAVEISRGPAFFDDRGHPTEALQRYTGSRLIQNSGRCLLVGALRLLGTSDRQIAEAIGCDVRSIPLMLRAAEASGQIPALKERLAQFTGDNAERAQLALAAALDRASDGRGDVDLAAMIKALATAGGINTQNLQLLTGGPTEILELRVGAGRAEIEAWAASVGAIVEVDGKPTDYESPAEPPKAMQMQGADTQGHGRDTDHPSPGLVPGPGTPDARGAGGGSPPPAGPQSDASTGF